MDEGTNKIEVERSSTFNIRRGEPTRGCLVAAALAVKGGAPPKTSAAALCPDKDKQRERGREGK